MDYYKFTIIAIALLILGITWLKIIGESRKYPKRRAIISLLTGFVLFVGISSVFADALFELLGLKKPQNFEIFSLIAYAIFAAAVVLLFRTKETVLKDPNRIKVNSIFAIGSKIAGNLGKLFSGNITVKSFFAKNSEIIGSDSSRLEEKKEMGDE